MRRFAPVRTTIHHHVNDENVSQHLKSKSVQENTIPLNDSNNNNNTATTTTTTAATNLNQTAAISSNARSRRVLGVVSNSALNSQTTTSLYQQQSQQSEQTTRRSRVSVYSEPSAPVSATENIPTKEEKLEQPQQPRPLPEVDEEDAPNEAEVTDYELDEEDIDDDDMGYVNDPISPIMNDNIYNKIQRAYNLYSKNYLDPEDEDTFDVTMVAEYGNQIFNYLHDLEIKFAPNPRYIEEKQTELLWDHRSTLMDWLVQLHSRFNLLPETLYLAVNIIDRFLSLKAISLSRFQLCGAVALFVAAKYEEINVPTVSQMTYMVGNQFSVSEFLKAEKFMIEVLKFEFGWPGPMSFLRRGSKADDYDNEVRTLAKYFLEITIMEPKLVSAPSSWLAAGAQFISRRMLGRGEWTDAHVFYSGYTVEQLEPLAELLEDCCLNFKTHHKAIYDKYSERRFKRSAIYVQEYLTTLYQSSSQ